MEPKEAATKLARNIYIIQQYILNIYIYLYKGRKKIMQCLIVDKMWGGGLCNQNAIKMSTDIVIFDWTPYNFFSFNL